MIRNITNSFGAARSDARINAFVVDARSRRTAFGVQGAFGSTTDIRITQIFLYACADGIVTFCISAAR